MPITKNGFANLYKSPDWSRDERVQLPPRTHVLLTGVYDGRQDTLRYEMVWAPVRDRLELGWLWVGHLNPDTFADTVPLRTKYPAAPANYKLYYGVAYQTRSRSYKNDVMSKLEAIQQLLADDFFVGIALMELERRAAYWVSQGRKYTKALDLTLGETERGWVSGPRITLRTQDKGPRATPSYTLVSPSGPLPFQRTFLQDAVKLAAPIKDVGAPVPHGEYAHRIQWYIIAFYFMDMRLWTPAGIQYVHHAMGRLRFLQTLVAPARADDPYRSLWDYVVDVRFNEPAEVGATPQVQMASPVRLTSKLLGYDAAASGPTLGAIAQRYKTIARAVANKRRKRALEDKQRGGKTLSAEEVTQLDPAGGWAARDRWLRATFPAIFT